MEQTLIIVKPDGVEQGLAGEILARFEKKGLKIVAAKMLRADPDLAERHYPEDRRELWEGIGHKSLADYEEAKLDPKEFMGTNIPYEIGKIVRGWLLKYIAEGPVVAVVLEGKNAVAYVREICGHTLPTKAAPGTIRGDLATDSATKANSEKRAIKNLVHASGTVDEAKYEIPLWFEPSEILSYERVEEKAMR